MSYVEKWLEKVQVECVGDSNFESEINEVECEYDYRKLSIDELDKLTRFHPVNRKFSDDVFLGDEKIYKLKYQDLENDVDDVDGHCRPACSACNPEATTRAKGRGRGIRVKSQTEQLIGSDHRPCHHSRNVKKTDPCTREVKGRSSVTMRGVVAQNEITNPDCVATTVDINHNVEKIAVMNIGDDKDELQSSSGSFITCASFKGSEEPREVVIQ